MWGCFLMSGVKILQFLKDWWKSIPIHQNYTMALRICNYQGGLNYDVFKIQNKLNKDDDIAASHQSACISSSRKWTKEEGVYKFYKN